MCLNAFKEGNLKLQWIGSNYQQLDSVACLVGVEMCPRAAYRNCCDILPVFIHTVNDFSG